MKILYLHQYFRKPSDGGAIRSYYLSKELVDKGVDVEIVTTHNNKNYRFENVEGIKVHFLPIKYDNRYSNFKRKISFLSFLIKSFFFIRKNIKNIDYCYATSTPLTVGLIALLLKKVNKIPYYFEVRDLWPEAPIQMETIKNPLIKKLLFWFEKIIYKNADKIITLSPGMTKGVQRFGLNKKIQMIPNVSDCDYFQKEEKQTKNTFYYGVGRHFVVSYIGAIGNVNNIDYILSIAKECKRQNLTKLIFLVAGRGSQLRRIRAKIQKLELKNVRLLGFQSRKDVKKLLNVTDASIITFADKPILETNSPNKFFDSLAAGKLCIVNNKGWIKDLIEKNACGFHSKSPFDFIEKIKPYLNDEKILKEAQSNARKLAVGQFSRRALSAEFVELFDIPISKHKKGLPIKKKIKVGV